MKRSRLIYGIPVVLALIAAATTSCVGYKLGSTLPPGIKSIYVTAFVNETKEPQIETDTTQATMQEFQRDGTLRVTAKDQADAMLDVTLTRFALEPLSYNRNDPLTTQEYRMRISARVVFTRLRPELKVMSDRTVQGEATFDLAGDMFTSKQRALPEASRDLAHDIVESVVEYW